MDELRVVAQPNLRELVAGRIRQAISSGRFKPGQRLIERELCEILGVSRTSVREALREIESEGLVTNVPNRGPIVATVDRDTAESIYEVRLALEGLAVKLFVQRATDQDVKALAAAFKTMSSANAGNSSLTYLEAKGAFYRILLEACRNDVVSDMLKSIHIRVHLLRVTSLSQTDRIRASTEEIREILDAVIARDETKAVKLMEHHIENAATAALTAIDARDAALAE